MFHYLCCPEARPKDSVSISPKMNFLCTFAPFGSPLAVRGPTGNRRVLGFWPARAGQDAVNRRFPVGPRTPNKLLNMSLSTG